MSAAMPTNLGNDAVADSLHQASAAASAPLLRFAIEPAALPRGTVLRTNLLDRLSRSVRETALTLISAPAGSGKTVLATSWAQVRVDEGPLAWLTIDDLPDQSGHFWLYLVEALTRAGIPLPHVEAPVAAEPISSSFLTWLSADINNLAQPVVVILDSSDSRLSADTTSGIEFLIRHASAGLRLVICGRSDPLLPLHRYRLSESMSEFRMAELAFTAAEAEELFANLGLPVSSEIAAALTDVTEGWVAGLRLAAMSLAHGADADHLVDSLVRDDSSVAEYLMAEVLDGLPVEVRQMLLDTSVTDELWPDLVDCLTDRTDGQRVLAGLVHANAFIAGPAHAGGPYRIHTLFRALLEEQLRFESPARIARLRRKCARWFADAGRPVPAVAHAIAGGDEECAAAIVIESLAVGGLLAHETNLHVQFMDSLSDDVPGAAGVLLRATRSLRSGDTPCESDEQRIAELAIDRANSLALRVSAAVILVLVAGTDPTDIDRVTAAADHAETLLAAVPVELQSEQRQLRAVVRLARASAVLSSAGGPDAAGELFGAAVAASEAAGSSQLRRRSLAGLAMVETLRGHYSRARDLGETAEGLSDSCGLPRSQRPGAAPLALAWAYCERFHLAEARRWALRTKESAPEDDGRLTWPLLAVVDARLFRSRHDLDAADDALRPFLSAKESPTWVQERVLLETAEIHLARSEPERAVRVLDTLPDPHVPRAELLRSRAASQGARSQFAVRDVAEDVRAPIDVQVDAWIDRAFLHLEPGGSSMAVAAVSHALKLAHPERLRRPFIDSSPQLRKMLRDDLAHADTGWLSRPAPSNRQQQPAAVPQTRSVGDPRSPTVVVGKLSEREFQVLGHLAELLSTDEIAAAMFVSVNTVRTHVRSILRKLAVSRRNEAVRRARELAII